MEVLQVLSRSEMKQVNGGGGPCSASITCPSGRTLHCETNNADGFCYEGDGFINCNTGQMLFACWQFDGPISPT